MYTFLTPMGFYYFSAFLSRLNSTSLNKFLFFIVTHWSLMYYSLFSECPDILYALEIVRLVGSRCFSIRSSDTVTIMRWADWCTFDVWRKLDCFIYECVSYARILLITKRIIIYNRWHGKCRKEKCNFLHYLLNFNGLKYTNWHGKWLNRQKKVF